ncbi:MAG: heavy-metal-associated domain-containing protein [Phycisphaerales bacterium]
MIPPVETGKPKPTRARREPARPPDPAPARPSRFGCAARSSRNPPAGDPPRRTVLVISGMRDNASREAVAEALANVPGVRDVSVSLMRAEAVVDHAPDCPPSNLTSAVTTTGCGAAIKQHRPRKPSL